MDGWIVWSWISGTGLFLVFDETESASLSGTNMVCRCTSPFVPCVRLGFGLLSGI